MVAKLPAYFFRSLLETLIDHPRHFVSYAACFCSSGNLLSQWRAYGNSGAGYEIEFDCHALESRFSNDRGETFGRVEYIEERQLDLLREIVACPAMRAAWNWDPEAIAERVREPLTLASMFDTDRSERDRKAAMAATAEAFEEKVSAPLCKAFRELTRCRAFIKSPAFKEECEWRIVKLQGKDSIELEFRQSRDLLVPYFPLDIVAADGRLPISLIRIGPTLHPARARDSLERFLRKRGLDAIEVVDSGIPLS